MSLQEHRGRSGAQLWAVAAGKTLETPSGTLTAGDEVLLDDVIGPAGGPSARARIGMLVGLGIVVRAQSVDHRRACVAQAEAAPVRFVVADATVGVIPHLDGHSPCAQGHATKGMRVRPSDVEDGLSGLLELEARGLLVRVTASP